MNSDNVVKLTDAVTLPGEPVASVIEDLERLLARARVGVLIGFAYATADRQPDGTKTHGTGWSGDSSRADLSMSIAMLQHRYTAAVLDG